MRHFQASPPKSTYTNILSPSTKRVSVPERSSSPHFLAHLQTAKYPKSIQKHINRKNCNMERTIEALKTPSKQFCAKEIRRLSELTKTQNEAYLEIVWQSSSKKRRLFDEENEIQSELSRKGVEIENPVLDVKKVFMLPSKYKRRKHEKENIRASDPISDFSRSSIELFDQSQESSVFQSCIGANEFKSEVEAKQPFGEIDENARNYICEERSIKYAEPEMLFKEVQNIQSFHASEFPVKEAIREEFDCENDSFDFVQEVYKSEPKDLLSSYEKENELIISDDFMEINEAQTPYIAPPFARVFSE